MKKILTPYQKGNLNLKNHIVMSPMTRSRAVGNVPNDLMVEYYRQRSGAGLIVTEGISPSPEGLGYPRIPGIFSDEQIAGWKKITDAVHENGSKIFAQFMHTGRAGHNSNVPSGYKIIGVSDIKMTGQIYSDVEGMVDYSQPTVLSTQDVKDVVDKHVEAAKNAVAAGFDGVEIHGAHGYLTEQFLNPNVNNRTDEYGGSIENRSRFVVETLEKMVDAIGADKVAIRISPFNKFNDQFPYDEKEVYATYAYLSSEFERLGIAYVHVSFNPDVTKEALEVIRKNYTGTIIQANGLTPESAEEALHQGYADLVAFGRSFISNPDLDKRIETGAALAEVDMQTLYVPGEKGYTDYPTLA